MSKHVGSLVDEGDAALHHNKEDPTVGWNCYRCGVVEGCECADGCTVICADSVELLTTGQLEHLPKFGAVVTDPPYSSGGMFRGDRAASTVTKYVFSGTKAQRSDFHGDNKDQLSFLAWSSLWLSRARSLCVDGASLCCWCDWRQVAATSSAVQAGGWVWRNLATWAKSNGRVNRGRFGSSCEHVVHASNGPCIEGQRSPRSWFLAPRVPKKQHIAEKPLSVMHWLLGVCPTGGPVFDPFAGSGSTLVACKEGGFPCVGIELSAADCDTICERLDRAIRRDDEEIEAEVVQRSPAFRCG